MAKKASSSLLIVGAGNMGSSLARGLKQMQQQKGRSAFKMPFRVFDHQNQKLEPLKKAGIRIVEKSKTLKLEADVIILCIKPQDLESFAQKYFGTGRKPNLIITILAGTSMQEVGEVLGFDGAIVRAMPNIAATVLSAATAMAANEHCTAADINIAQQIFASVGEAFWTEEHNMDAVTGLSGSGPAYIYMVIEALTDGGVKMGIPRELSASLATQTVLGAATLVKTSGVHPAILKDQVTTPGGTTISAVHELESHGLRPMLISAVVTATERSALLRKRKKSFFKK